MLSAIALSQTVVGCLPDSGRLPPGEATLVISAGEALTDGVVTADGFRIRFDRVLIAGFADLWGSDICIDYASESYLRVVDAARPGEHKVAAVFGLNECNVAFQLTPPPPSEDVVPGEGVTVDDVTALTNNRASLEIVGRATQGERTWSFDWSIGRTNSYPDCLPTLLRSRESSIVSIKAEAQFLFGATEPRFEGFAAADLDGDGAILLDEVSSSESLAEEVRQGVDQLLRYEGRASGTCEGGSK